MEDEWKFASALINTGDYESAAISLKRYALFGQDAQKCIYSRFIVGSIYEMQQKHDSAAQVFIDLSEDVDIGQYYQERASFLAAQSFFGGENLADYHITLDRMSTFPGRTLSPEAYSQRQYLLGFLGVYAANNQLAQLLPVDTGDDSIKKKSKELKDQMQWWSDHESKIPWLACVLSTVCPGAGQIYNNRYWDAFLASSLVLGGGWWSYRLFERDEDHWGWTIGVITGFMYLGQIRNSVVDAIRINDLAVFEFKKNLVDQFFLRFSVGVQGDSICLGVSF